ncbi:hypothetical protein MAPG_00244 [Magnaporthiopsis poae ATCC 64411]|uniref:Rhodopsin domain-containing protein n=1 Tax=Magnaporthiopsis poae (strain ATCC 64411 / 73-15) TaxID=644358 RepID=A0A0C4DKH2_MAGP6|nr:hypothetical protein MAPG_00244 [Magnaporthiopsis poae ATCC 64411]
MADLTPAQLAETNGPMVSSIGIAFGVGALVFLILRFYTRGVILKAIGKDDWAILVATIFSLGNSVCLIFEVKYGMGRHQAAVGAEEGVEQLKVGSSPRIPTPRSRTYGRLIVCSAQYLLGSILLYNFGMNVVKLGFLFQFKRIFQDAIVQRICFWFTIYVCVWAIVQALLLSFACLPLGFIVPSMANKCLDPLTIWYISSVMSMATDIAIFCIPLPSVWKLQLPIKQKLMVMGIFCLGFL